MNRELMDHFYTLGVLFTELYRAPSKGFGENHMSVSINLGSLSWVSSSWEPYYLRSTLRAPPDVGNPIVDPESSKPKAPQKLRLLDVVEPGLGEDLRGQDLRGQDLKERAVYGLLWGHVGDTKWTSEVNRSSKKSCDKFTAWQSSGATKH